jgi:hypothetical protein
MITYKWIFSAFDCKVSENGMQNIVTNVHWRYNGTNKDDISAEIYGTQAVGEPTPDAFIPYPKLSEEQVIGWMEEAMDVEELQTNIANQIDAISNPVNVTLPTPWSESFN